MRLFRTTHTNGIDTPARHWMTKSDFGPMPFLVLRLCVTAFLVYLILENIDLRRCLETLEKARLAYFLVPCALHVVSLLIASVRLKWILMGYLMPIRLGRALELNWIAGFFNNVLPSSIGGDVYRIIHLNRAYGGRPAQVVSAVILDRGLGLLVMLGVAGLTGVWFIDALISRKWVIVVLYSALVLVILGSCFVLFVEHRVRLSHVSRYPALSKIVNGLNILIRYPNKKALASSVGCSFVSVALMVLAYYVLFLAFDSDISPLILLFVIPVVNLAGLIPFSINALGITEGVGILLFSSFGYEPELVLSVFLAGRMLQILCSATGGLPFLVGRGSLRIGQQ